MPVGLSMCFRAAAEVVSFYSALESASFGSRGSVHQISGCEEGSVYLLAQFDFGKIVYAKFAQDTKSAIDPALMSGFRPIESARFVET